LALVTIAALAVVYTALMTYRIFNRRYDLFFADYVRWTFTPAAAVKGPKDIFLFVADHWEPDYDVGLARRWTERYAAMAARHRDATGRKPQHTWFYPGEQAEADILPILREQVQAGLGEVELHYHHNYDTSETVRIRYKDAIDEFQRYGFLKTIDGKTQFAFIHGNFGLDNANGTGMCGVDNELRILRELGCFADFSFPSVYRESQPSTVNAIYAAKDAPGPKSYDTPLPLSRLFDGSADLMMFTGPLVFAPSTYVRRLFLDLDDANLHAAMPASPHRIARWLRANVHVPQRPDWVFIKLWAHGASSPEDEEETIGPRFDALLTAFERDYNDGRRYRLHYITAREAYNLAYNAARGAAGNYDSYLDTPVAPYLADPRAIVPSPEGTR
jgi:hypothetical protein